MIIRIWHGFINWQQKCCCLELNISGNVWEKIFPFFQLCSHNSSLLTTRKFHDVLLNGLLNSIIKGIKAAAHKQAWKHMNAQTVEERSGGATLSFPLRGLKLFGKMSGWWWWWGASLLAMASLVLHWLLMTPMTVVKLSTTASSADRLPVSQPANWGWLWPIKGYVIYYLGLTMALADDTSLVVSFSWLLEFCQCLSYPRT